MCLIFEPCLYACMLNYAEHTRETENDMLKFFEYPRQTEAYVLICSKIPR